MKKVLFSCFAAALSFGATAQTLVFHTTFNGGAATDLSGNGLNGTVIGAVPAAGFTGAANTALRFDGVNDYVVLPTNAAFNLNGWTLQAMVRFNGFYTGTCHANSIIWHGTQFQQDCYSLYVGDNYYELLLGVPPGQNVCTFNSGWRSFNAFGPGSSATPDFVDPYYTANGYVQTGVWYCVTATFSPAAGNVMSVYIDGTLIEQDVWNSGVNYNYTGNVPTYIGCSNTPGGAYPYWFNGVMDQVSIWNGGLTGAQAAGHCQKTRQGSWKQTADENEAIKSVNIMEIANEKIEIAPNPANAEINVTVPECWKGGKMVIMNGVGQILMDQDVTGTKHTIDISELPIGIYMLKTMKGNEVKVEKFIKN